MRVEGRKFNISHQSVSNYLNRNGIQYRKKERAPLISPKQREKIIRTSRKLATKSFVRKTVIIDDEKYFRLSNSEQSGNSGYYADNKFSIPEDVRFKKKSKYEPKVLVWVAFSEDGMAEPFIKESTIAIDAERYINKCLKPKLFKFIRSWYNHDEYVFWPDLASAHYGKTTIETFKVKKLFSFLGVTTHQCSTSPFN